MRRRRLTTFGRILKAGVLGFGRNASLAIAAMAVMIITLTIILFSIISSATFNNTVKQITDKIDISIYLKDSVTADQRDKLLSDIRSFPNTLSVKYNSKDDVLKQYIIDNAENESLLSAISQTNNPLPATIQVKPRDLDKLEEMRTYLEQPNIKEMQSDPPSYSGDRKEAIDKITHAANLLARAGIIVVGIFMIISVLIIFNTIQMAIFNRRDELTIMRLLGARTWYIRGPFVVESIIYGVLSALISTAFVHVTFKAASSTLQATSLGLLDIDYAVKYLQHNLLLLLTFQLAVGILIGAVSSVIATRRYLKFKSR